MKWFYNLKIRTKLGLGFGTLLALFIVALVVTTLLIEGVKNNSEQVANETVPFLMRAYELDIAAVRVSENLTDVSATHNPDGFKEAEKSAVVVREELAKFKEMFRKENNTKALKEVEDIESGFGKFYETGKRMAQVYISQGREQGNEMMGNFDKEREKLTAEIEKLQKAHADEATANTTGIVKTVGKILSVLFVVCAFSMVLGVLIAFFITRSITRPIVLAMETSNRLADGDLTVTIEVTSKDEAGQLLTAMKKMVEKLKTLIEDVKSAADNVSSSAQELSASSEQMATGSEEVASQAGAVAAASEEMAATSSEIAKNCGMAAEGSQHANDSATTGASVVQQTVAVMSRIAERVRESAKTVESLGERSDQIGAIIGTIEDIADQTNLLALNAAIEAARAGEQGRGFAVVADEVRALAERTTKATREIGEMIKAVQQETKGAVSAMDEGVKEVEKGTCEASKSGEALQEILNQINAVTMQVSQIATAAEQQTATTNEITNNIQQITLVVQETSNGAHESANAAIQLSGLAEKLQLIVNQFKLAA